MLGLIPKQNTYSKKKKKAKKDEKEKKEKKPKGEKRYILFLVKINF
jgi:hypothetical protein